MPRPPALCDASPWRRGAFSGAPGSAAATPGPRRGGREGARPERWMDRWIPCFLGSAASRQAVLSLVSCIWGEERAKGQETDEKAPLSDCHPQLLIRSFCLSEWGQAGLEGHLVRTEAKPESLRGFGHPGPGVRRAQEGEGVSGSRSGQAHGDTFLGDTFLFTKLRGTFRDCTRSAHTHPPVTPVRIFPGCGGSSVFRFLATAWQVDS